MPSPARSSRTSRLEKVISFRVISAADRLPVLMDDRVDIVVRNMTMNCARWEDIAFSAVYYESGQKLLVRQDLAEQSNPVDTVAELSGLSVCAPLGTTSLTNIQEQAPDGHRDRHRDQPHAVPGEVPAR